MLKDRFFFAVVIIVAILVLEDFDRQECGCRESESCAPVVPEPLPCEPVPAPPCRCGRR